MGLVYLVLAQAYPEQLFNLVEALNDSDIIFVIHVDRKQLLKTFSSAFRGDERKNIYFLKDRCSTELGGIKLSQAVLNGLKYICRKYQNANRVIILNGQDYPIKSKEYINSYFKATPNNIFIQYFPNKDNKFLSWPNNGFPFYNKNKQSIKHYTGSLFGMSLPIWAIRIVIDFLKTHSRFLTSFKDVELPNESFFQTLLLNCGRKEITKNIVNQNLRLVKWDKYLNPTILNGQDINLIKEDASLFAGKFDPERSFDLLVFIDNNILKLKKNIHRNNSLVKKVPDIQNPKGNAILFLTDKWDGGIMEKYNKLKRTSLMDRDVHLIYHDTGKRLPRSLKKLDPFVFDNSILNCLGYKPISSKLVPGSNHFPLLKFYLEHPQYRYYWNIEDDVYFNGKWETFFDYFSQENIVSDFLSCNVNDYNDQSLWYWWNTIAHPFKEIAQISKVRSFNPIFRISNRALKFLHEELSEEWCGHHEVLIPTLLKNAGFIINDFGGTGKYVLPECRNKFYISSPEDEGLSSGTMRFRPVIRKEEISEELLYHPVKF